MTLMAQYESAVASNDIQDDPDQRKVLASMQELRDDLQKKQHSWLNWLSQSPIQGFYLYGPVGVGKTYLMDLFYDSLPDQQKARFHFHHFMQQIDVQLRRLQGQKDPLKHIATELAKKTRFLCFDEFMVHDVAYAMILAELLQALFAVGVVLMATANISPDELYLDGVHRERFLPAIELIKSHCRLLTLTDKKDYRLGREPSLEAYLYPLNLTTEQRLASQFASLAQTIHDRGDVIVQNRAIPFVKCSERAIWFEFNVICNLPRSQLDYLEIADRFDAVFISNIPQLTENDTVPAILLIHFIDVMYDRGINLIISAAVPLQQLYDHGEMSETFKRTLSRLQEMQSADYLRRHPRREVQDLLKSLS